MSGSQTTDRPRADARRNRGRLLLAAHETFTACGADASLDEVARRAGVGSGTLYRHFATRADLIEALFEERLAALEQHAAILSRVKPPEAALFSWLQAFTAHVSSYRGLAEILSRAMSDEAPEILAHWYDRVRTAGEPLLREAQAHRKIRADLTMTELLRLMSAVASASHGDEKQSQRLSALIIEGLQDTTVRGSGASCGPDVGPTA